MDARIIPAGILVFYVLPLSAFPSVNFEEDYVADADDSPYSYDPLFFHSLSTVSDKEYKKRSDLLKSLGDRKPSLHLEKGKMQKLALSEVEILEFFPLDSFVAHLCKKSSIPLSSLGPSTSREYLQAIGAAHTILGDLCRVSGHYIESHLDSGSAHENKYLCSLSTINLVELTIFQVIYFELIIIPRHDLLCVLLLTSS